MTRSGLRDGPTRPVTAEIATIVSVGGGLSSPAAGADLGGSPGVGAGCWADRAAQIVPLWAWRTWGLSAPQGGPGTGRVLRGVSEWYELCACGKL